MPSDLISDNQVTLLAWLTEQGHVRLRLISFQRGATIIGPVPLIRVNRGFLGIRGGYTLGWEGICQFLESVVAVILYEMTGAAEEADNSG